MIVLLCEDLERLGNGLDLGAVTEWLEARAPGIEVRRASGPCQRPERWLDRSLAEDRLVLGLCATNGDRHELHAWTRKLGLDPFGLEVLNLGAYCAMPHPRPEATEKAKLLLGAAVARAQAYPGSRPENARPLLSWGGEKVSRRSLLTLPPIQYEVVPSIREEVCSAGTGCRVCAKACPRDALSPSGGGRMMLNKAQCTGCGACVSLCPQRAVDFPGASLPEIEARIAALLSAADPSLRPRGILFHCEKSVPALERLARKGGSYPAGWLPVELPCIGMVTPAWVLQSLNEGAAAVGVFPCGRADCRFGQRHVIEGRVNYCRELLRQMGGSPDAVKALDATDETELARALAFLPALGASADAKRTPALRVSGPRAIAQAVLGLADKHEAPLDRPLAHPFSPLGVVEVARGCTGCGACALACPTGALALQREDGAVSLSFDARLCIGCEECVPACPEVVVRAQKVTDRQALSAGKRTLFRDSEVRCEKCGAPVASREMLGRISAILGKDPALSVITRYCLTCRGSLL